MDLTEDDVLEILKLFEQSKFDFLHLEEGDRRITVSKAGHVSARPEMPRPAVSTFAPTSAATPVSAAPAAQTGPAQASAPEPGLVPVTAPMVGKFYSAPSPADPPYVEKGSKIAVDATVGLIEVMKVFTSVKTEASGVIERILVSNGQFVEFGQTLFWLRPDGA